MDHLRVNKINHPMLSRSRPCWYPRLQLGIRESYSVLVVHDDYFGCGSQSCLSSELLTFCNSAVTWLTSFKAEVCKGLKIVSTQSPSGTNIAT